MRQSTRDYYPPQGQLPTHLRIWSMRWWEEQPESPSAGGTAPLGELDLVRGTFTDDVARPVQRQMTVDIATVPDGLKVGMWVQGSVGIRGVDPRLYDLPVMMVTSLDHPHRLPAGGGSLTCEDPSAVLNVRPYTADTTLTGTLRTLIADCCTVALTRTTDVSGVPNIALPEGAQAEFGAGRWDTCLRFGDLLNVQLRFTDAGDVIGRLRTNIGTSAGVLIPTGNPLPGLVTRSRWPTEVYVLVSRGSNVPELIGYSNSDAQLPRPPWYRPVVLTQRMEADPNTTQEQADEMAYQFLRAAIADILTFDSLSVLPAPWLEAGQDYVSVPYQAGSSPNDVYYETFRLRSFTMDLPSLATTVNLRAMVWT